MDELRGTIQSGGAGLQYRKKLTDIEDVHTPLDMLRYFEFFGKISVMNDRPYAEAVLSACAVCNGLDPQDPNSVRPEFRAAYLRSSGHKPGCKLKEIIDLLRKDSRAADTLRSDLPARRSQSTQKLTALLEECRGILQLCLTTPVLLQPEVRAVKALGAQMGYGAIMSTAAGVWRESLKDRGIEGGAFTVGPCGDTVKAIIEKIDNMLVPEEPPCPRDCQHLAQDQSGWWCRHYNTSDGIWADPAENCYTPPSVPHAEEPTQS